MANVVEANVGWVANSVWSEDQERYVELFAVTDDGDSYGHSEECECEVCYETKKPL